MLALSMDLYGRTQQVERNHIETKRAFLFPPRKHLQNNSKQRRQNVSERISNAEAEQTKHF
jgi:hypothetical protein